MSAPENAITLEEEAEKYWVNPEDIENHRDPVGCYCGWEGRLSDLLCDPDDDNPRPNDFWCPRCRHGLGWSFI